jgi:proton-dependent oligopeptide transporter, POT family
MAEYLTTPPKITGIPKGIPYIVGNEAAERFSYYGMRAILVVFMTQYLRDSAGNLAVMEKEQATYWFHLFMSAVYILPFVGALISDFWLGKYRTIMALSIVYCLGHAALAVNDTRIGLAIGLGLIAVGAGGIKPCVSAHVGDQFATTNQHHIPKVYSWFYFSINAGSFISTLLTPILLHNKNFGPAWAFGIPGVLMLIATLVFWMGRNKFVHIPPSRGRFMTLADLPIIFKLSAVFLFVAVFWCLYDQTASAWVLQAAKMDLKFLGHTWLPAQIHAVNPLLILLYIPLFAYLVFPLLNKVFKLTPLRKIGIGFFLTVPSFWISGWIESQILAGNTPNIGWQILGYMVITAAEVFVSMTGLEFAYTQAPPRLKSLIMSLFLGSVSLGNAFTALVNWMKSKGIIQLKGADYFYFFANLMLGASVIFVFVALWYKEKKFIQGEHTEPAPGH